MANVQGVKTVIGGFRSENPRFMGWEFDHYGVNRVPAYSIELVKGKPVFIFDETGKQIGHCILRSGDIVVSDLVLQIEVKQPFTLGNWTCL